MTTKTHVLQLRELPRSSNRPAANRFQLASEKKKWEGKFLVELMANRVKKGAVHANCRTTIRWKTRNKRDWHNYFGGIVKSLADALVTGGYLPDDTGDYFNMETPFTIEYGPEWPAGALHKVELVISMDLTYE